MKEYLIIEAKKEEYNFNKIENTMTVKELKEKLEDYDDETKMIISFDNGYTYGRVKFFTYEEEYEEEENGY